jgi:hypothetical protein
MHHATKRFITVVASSSSSSDPTSLLKQKEQQLQSLFEPGKLAPKSSQVASLRKEIVELQQKVIGFKPSVRKTTSPPLSVATISSSSSSSLSRAPTSFISSPGQAVLMSKTSTNGLETSENNEMTESARIRRAMLLVEAKLAEESGQGCRESGSFDDAEEMARLIAENEYIRKMIVELDERQKQLMKIWTEHSSSSSSSRSSRSRSSSKSDSGGGEEGEEKKKPKKRATTTTITRRKKSSSSSSEDEASSGATKTTPSTKKKRTTKKKVEDAVVTEPIKV